MKKSRIASGRSSRKGTGASKGSSKTRRLRVGKRTWTVKWVADVPKAANHLPLYGFRGVRGNILGLVDEPLSRILIKEDLSDFEEQATLFHELLHVASPTLSELHVARIERVLYPLLRRYGLRLPT